MLTILGRWSRKDASATEAADQDRYPRQTLLLAAVTLTPLIAAVIAVALAAPWLNQYGFLHFPLGFYLAAQGLLIVIIAVAFWFTHTQDSLDRKHEEREEL